MPTKELIIEKFEEAIVNKENKDENLINFKNQLQKLQDDYHVRDMAEGKERSLRDFIKANETYLKSIKVNTSNIYDLCVNEKQGKELILKEGELDLYKELFIDEEMKGMPILSYHHDLEYDKGADTDTEKTHSPDISSQSSEESDDDKQVKDKNIGKHTAMLERKSNQDRER